MYTVTFVSSEPRILMWDLNVTDIYDGSRFYSNKRNMGEGVSKYYGEVTFYIKCSFYPFVVYFIGSGST